jgi:hypothetical protein
MEFETLAVLLAQAAMWGVTILVVWYTARKRLNRSERGANISALVVALDPMCIWSSGIVMTETLFALLMAASIYLALGESRPSLARAGLLLGAATLVRPDLIPARAARRHSRRFSEVAQGDPGPCRVFRHCAAVARAECRHPEDGLVLWDLRSQPDGVSRRRRARQSAGASLDQQTQSVYDRMDFTQSPPVIAANLRRQAIPVLLAHPVIAPRG